MALHVTAEQVNQAKRLMALATLESIRLIHVRAAHMTTPGCPVRSLEEKPHPTALANIVEGTNKFRVLVGHAIHGKRGSDETTEIQIDASFELIYSVPEDATPTAEELQAFADTNALLNCWPYWRELVQSMISRMGLPPLVLPLFRLLPEQKPKPVSEQARESAPQEAGTR